MAIKPAQILKSFASSSRILWRVVLLLAGLCAAQPASAQVGRCFDQVRGQAYDVYPNLWMVQIGNPANQGQAMRDPSGLNFMRVPASTPYQAFFVNWQGQVIEINPSGWFQIGYCQFSTNIIPPNPYDFAYQPPQMANWGVRVSGAEVVPVPQAFANTRQRYVPPLYATADTAQSCMDESGDDQDAFADCMLQRMLGDKERQIYECSKDGADKTAVSLCIVGIVGGSNERRSAQQVANCYAEHQDDWEQYPMCMADQNIGGDGAKLLACVRKQSESGEVTFAGTAICYAAGSLRLNPEWQIAVECAATSGGEPLTFAGCAGGRLTARELEKCFTDGIGGSGCFGPNNEIVKALRNVGLDMNNAFGPNNDLVKIWNNGVNDIQNGPGPNNEVVKVFSTVGNDIANGPGRNNDIVKAIDNVVPGFSDFFGG